MKIIESIKISVGYEHDDTYKELNRVFSRDNFQGKYKEDIMIEYPYLFFDNSNEKVIHVNVTNMNDIESILVIADKNISMRDTDALSLSLLWNFPRKKYDENLMWACLSGYVYGKVDNDVRGNNFVVSDNVVKDIASATTDRIIEYINGMMDESRQTYFYG